MASPMQHIRIRYFEFFRHKYNQISSEECENQLQIAKSFKAKYCKTLLMRRFGNFLLTIVKLILLYD